MCGTIAILLGDQERHVNQMLFDGLTMLQHRGQDAAGMITSDGRRLHMRKDNGLVKDVFQQQHMPSLIGSMGVAHCRYPTAGSSSSAEAQPMYTNFPFGVCIAHNGNLTNADELRDSIYSECRHINTDSDSELMLNVFAEELNVACSASPKGSEPTTFFQHPTSQMRPSHVFTAARQVMTRCTGGFAVLGMINGKGVFAFRDRNGIRPLSIGSRESLTMTDAKDWVVASESAAMDTLLFQHERDLRPGEAIFIDVAGNFYSEQVCEPSLAPCLFEYVYFARPDSVLDGVVVYESRLNMGEALAKKIMRKRPDHDIDVVIPVPDTSRTAALQTAYTLDRPFREGFIKNRYIARTFIMPGQETRKKTVRLKLNTIRSEFKDKVVLLVDDSIVRGTTSMELVQMARDAGAKKVYFVSAAPPVRYPNVYGIDIPTRQELIAFERTEEQVAEKMGADWVIYQDLEDLEACITRLNPDIQRFDSSCFSGRYVTGDITDEYLEKLYGMRSENAKLARESSGLNGSGTFSSFGGSGMLGSSMQHSSSSSICESLHNAVA